MKHFLFIAIAFAVLSMSVFAALPGGGGGSTHAACSQDADCAVGKYCSFGACTGLSTACVADGVCVAECGRARTPDPDCNIATATPVSSTATPSSFPTASSASSTAAPVSSPSPALVDRCGSFGTARERLKCRIELPDDREYDYEPEECRATADATARGQCNSWYKATQKCFELPDDAGRFACARKALGVSSVRESIAACNGDSRCIGPARSVAFALVKFRFYDLEERSGVFWKAGASEATVLDLVAALEQLKVDFNNAKTNGERTQVVLQVRSAWREFKAKAVAEILAKK